MDHSGGKLSRAGAAVGVAASLFGVLACAEDGPSSEPAPEPTCCSIGPSFLWGSATAAHQVEGDTAATDWLDWEALPGKIHDGDGDGQGDRVDDGPNHAEHFEADYAEAKAMGHNAYRFSLDWARLQPAPGAPLDPDAVALYRRMLASMRANGLVPMATLQHFTLPRWLHDVNDGPEFGQGGWAGRSTDEPGRAPVVAAFEEFTRLCAAEFGGEIDLWVTLNEPTSTLLLGYLDGRFPPGVSLSFSKAQRAYVNMLYAHAASYRALHAHDTVDADGDGAAASVSIAQHVRVMRPKTPGDREDELAARDLDYIANWAMLDAAARGELDRNLDGDTDDEGDLPRAPELGPTLDWVGINYYTTFVIESLPITDDETGFTFPGLPSDNEDPAAAKNELGWEIHPDGFRVVLLEAQRRYGLPIYVTENGVPDSTGTARAPFVVDHVAAMQAAMAEGADVRGYLHWSLMDNFEWAEGFAPRFGLLRVDYGRPERPRTRTRGAEALSAIIAAGGVDDSIRLEYAQ